MRLRTIEPWTLATAWRRSPLPMRLHSVPAGKGVHTVGKPHADAVDWLPAVDIVEQDDHFVLRADLPGVAPEHIEYSAGSVIAASFCAASGCPIRSIPTPYPRRAGTAHSK
jgi:hypothetical protein